MRPGALELTPATLEVLLCADSSSDCTGPTLLFCRGDLAPAKGSPKRTTPVVSVLPPSMGAGSSITQQMCWAARSTMWVPSQTGWRSQAARSRAMPRVSDAQRCYLTTAWPTAASPTNGKVDTRQWQYRLAVCPSHPQLPAWCAGCKGGAIYADSVASVTVDGTTFQDSSTLRSVATAGE